MEGLFFAGLICGRLAAGRRFCRVQSRYACPAVGYFSMEESNKRIFRSRLQSPNGVAKFYKRCSFVRLPGEGLLFCEEK